MKRIISCEAGEAVYLAGKQTAKGLSIKRYAVVPFSELLEGAEQLEAAVGELVRNYRLKGKEVQIILPSQGVLFRELYLPPIHKEKQLEESVLNEMLYYHSNIEEYTVAYLASGRTNDAGQKGYFAYALRNTAIEEIRRMFDKLGLKHTEITIMADCMARLTGMCYPDSRLSIVLDVHTGCIELYLIENGCCVLARRVSIKYETFNGNLDIFAAELADQVGRILQFQRTRRNESALEKILVAGTIPDLERVTALLQAELEAAQAGALQCALFDFQTKLRFSPKISRDMTHQPEAAGALLRRK